MRHDKLGAARLDVVAVDPVVTAVAMAARGGNIDISQSVPRPAVPGPEDGVTNRFKVLVAGPGGEGV